VWGALAFASVATIVATIFGFQRGTLSRENGEIRYALEVSKRRIVLLESELRAARRPPLSVPESVDVLRRVSNDPSL